MNASKKVTLTIVLVFSAVFAVLIVFLYQQALEDLERESSAATAFADTLLGEDLSKETLVKLLRANRHLAVDTTDQGDIKVGANTSYELAEIIETGQIVLLVFVLALILTLVALRYAVNSRLRPLAELCGGLDSIRDGNYRVLVKGNDIEEIDTLIQHYQQLRDDLESKQQQVLTLRQRVVDLQEMERQSLARELHDNVGQLITGVSMQTFMLKHLIDNPEALEGLARIQQYCERLHEGTRLMSNQLYPIMLQRLGLLESLHQLCLEWCEIHKLDLVFVSHIEQISDDPSRDTQIYRIVQELLNNVAKHAKATRVELNITWVSNHSFRLQLSDNGSGLTNTAALVNASRFPVKQCSGMGFESMAERARLLKADLSVINGESGGVTAVLVVPIKSNDAVAED